MIPTARIPLAEPVSTGNIWLGTWTFSYGGLTVGIRRRDSGLARYFVATVGKRLWATLPSRVVLDLCSQRSNCVAGSLLVASAHTASRWRTVVGDWQTFIREYILHNHSQWEDFGYHQMTTTSIKRYLIATQWSIGRGPTVLGKRERSVTTISQFLTFFPNPQSIIYIVIELEVEDHEQH